MRAQHYRDPAVTLTNTYRAAAIANRTYPITLKGVNANTSPAATIAAMINAVFGVIVPWTSRRVGIGSHLL